MREQFKAPPPLCPPEFQQAANVVLHMMGISVAHITACNCKVISV